jgi:hypothetical protein
MTFSGLHEAGPVVLCATGPETSVTALLKEALPLLAHQLGLEPLPALAPVQEPDRCLASLRQGSSATGNSATALAPLWVDPGMTLQNGQCWAQALGAWARPTLILIEAGQLGSGSAAASTALMAQLGVPLLGLIQWGGPWQASLRRLDGLPWLGVAGPEDPAESDDLRLALALRAARVLEPEARGDLQPMDASGAAFHGQDPAVPEERN